MTPNTPAEDQGLSGASSVYPASGGDGNGNGNVAIESSPAGSPLYDRDAAGTNAVRAPREALPVAPRTRLPWVLLVVVLVLAIFGILFLAGFLPRLANQKKLNAAAHRVATDPPLVRVTPVLTRSFVVHLTLPGNVNAFQQTQIHSRVNGYVKKWLVDIGTHVKAGQLLATIDTPDIDAQLRQAKANLFRAKADEALNANLLRREKYMQSKGAASPVDVIDQQLKVNASAAGVKVNQAAVRNLLIQKSYANVTAPYAGIITARNIDVGTLVTSGSAANVSSLFTLDQINPVRIYVFVPQSDAALVRPGTYANVLASQYPGKIFQGKITRSAGALNSNTRTLLTEIDVPNPKGRLLPGMFVRAQLVLAQRHPPVRVPDNTLRVVTHGPEVVVVNRKNVVHVQPVVLGHDNGVTVEVVQGLKPGQRVVVSPSDFLKNGQRVRIAAKRPGK